MNSHGDIGDCSRVTLLYNAIVGATEGSIMAAIITTQTVRNHPSVPRLVQGPPSIPRILISDTVGFIKKLPHDLVASFRSTLEEALNADLLLFVVDSADPTFRQQLEVTRQVLGEIGALGIPSLLLLNKSLADDPAGAVGLGCTFSVGGAVLAGSCLTKISSSSA